MTQISQHHPKTDFKPATGGVAYLWNKWQEVICGLALPQEIGHATFQKVLKAYTDENRKYHGLSHIKHMLQEVDSFTAENPHAIKEPEVLTLAIFMHDFVNGTPDDVQQSDEMAGHILSCSTMSELTKKRALLHEIIMATTHQKPLESKSSIEAKIIADADLSILGSDKRTYNQYALQVRQEYKHYSDEIFTAGRIKVLQSFLNRSHIYTLDFFQQKYEMIARQNITSEVQALQKNAQIMMINHY